MENILVGKYSDQYPDPGEDGGEKEQGGQVGHWALLGFHDSGGKYLGKYFGKYLHEFLGNWFGNILAMTIILANI